jgi:ABC-type Na+ efflux pump permease subunit
VTENNLSQGVEALGFMTGLLIAAVIDIITFGVVAAIPLAAVVYLGLIAQSTAMFILALVAGFAVLRVLFVGVLQAMSDEPLSKF